jgi:ribose transport system ATP-binding protein
MPGVPLLHLKSVSKYYGGVTALKGVEFTAQAGSIHAILGENGAGKSTLMRILAGATQPSEGEFRINGHQKQFRNPREAAENGIVCIFQELSVIPDLNVAANVCLADPPLTALGLIDRRKQREITQRVFEEMGVGEDIDPLEICRTLPLSKRQLVEIAKAVARKPKVLILDEATSALTVADVAPVMTLLRKLRDEGVLIIFISHRMHEVEQLADTCSVFRNGEHVATFANGSRSDQEIVQMMIGRPIDQVFPAKPAETEAAQAVLTIDHLEWGNKLRKVTLQLRQGEVLGLGGLDGQGQQEILQAAAGLLRGMSGSLTYASGAQGSVARFALVSEDRKTGGLFLPLSIRENLTCACIRSVSHLGVISATRENNLVRALTERLQIKVADHELPVDTLSGGNQQKVVLAKWLATDPDVLLLMDPTRGIDVGTKQEIYRLVRDLAAEGKSILLYSTDYDELIGLCDRVVIVYDGELVAELSGATLTEENILLNALSLKSADGVLKKEAS